MIATISLASLSLPTMEGQSDTRHPPAGYLGLARQMDTDEDEQFDVDLTILDFLVYKATGLLFEWKQSDDPYHSDLPSALVSMTAGTYGALS